MWVGVLDAVPVVRFVFSVVHVQYNGELYCSAVGTKMGHAIGWRWATLWIDRNLVWTL
jgi:hypothetical protein